MNKKRELFANPACLEDVNFEHKIPTVCLIASNNAIPQGALINCVETMIKAGCTYFMTWGKASESTEDAIDQIIEDLGEDYMGITTSAHAEESVDDVSDFFVNFAIPTTESLRCIILTCEETAEFNHLINCANYYVNKFNRSANYEN